MIDGTVKFRNGDSLALKAFANFDNTHSLSVKEFPNVLPVDSRYFMSYELEKSVTGNIETHLISIKNTSQDQKARLGTLGLTTRGNKDVMLLLHYDATVNGDWIDYPDNSYVQYNKTSTTFTADPSKAADFGLVMKENDSTRLNLFKGDVMIILEPNQTLTLTAFSKTSTEVSYFFRHIEHQI